MGRDFSKYTIFPENKKGNKYYYAARTYRVKINPDNVGKNKGSGKSKVVCEKIYLGTAQEVLSKLTGGADSPQKISSYEYGLPMAVYKLAHDIGVMDIMD